MTEEDFKSLKVWDIVRHVIVKEPGFVVAKRNDDCVIGFRSDNNNQLSRSQSSQSREALLSNGMPWWTMLTRGALINWTLIGHDASIAANHAAASASESLNRVASECRERERILRIARESSVDLKRLRGTWPEYESDWE